MNYGAEKPERIRECRRYAIYTSIRFGVFWTLLSICFPDLYIYTFMTPTENVLKIGPEIIRAYALSFLILPFNLFSTYYFQSVLQAKISLIVSLMRGIVLSGIMVMILPMIWKPDTIWYSMIITEIIVAVYVVNKMKAKI